MSTTLLTGQRKWSMSRDTDGNREYKITFMVKGDSTDGPANVLQTAGLPVVGDTWNFDDDSDEWAFCKQNATVTPILTEEPNLFWTVEQTFSSKPDDKKCKDKQIDDPLLQPMEVSGGFTKYNEEATVDLFGQPITNSAWEAMRGHQVEFDKNRPTVKIKQNVANLDLGLLSGMVDCVNDAPLWGLPPRCIKMTAPTWERKFYGQCFPYFVRTLEFECRFDTFDRRLLDEGQKVLSGHWDTMTGLWALDEIAGYTDSPNPDPTDPTHFVRFKDRNGENAKVVLDGFGKPALQVTTTSNLFISIIDGNEDPTSTITSWVPIVGPVDGVQWTATAAADGAYKQGSIVFLFLLKYVATEDPGDVNPGAPSAFSSWLELPLGINDQGEWNESFAYAVGDTVDDPTSTTSEAGSIRVVKYGPANFLLLGIPTDLESSQ